MSAQLRMPVMGLLLTFLAGIGTVAPVQGQGAREPSQRPRPWTSEEVQEAIRLSPRDPYLQYVMMQLARREGNVDAGRGIVENSLRGIGFRDARQAGLFDLFSGALAVQESLQLERMLGAPRRADVQRVPIASLTGPTMQSHPWEKMLGGKKPEISPLAHFVPQDFYFVEFRSLTKMLDLIDQGDLWGRHFFSQGDRDARSHLVGERLRRQLAVETSALARPFYDRVVAEVAMTGSDLYLREGSDVTLIFRHRSADVFQTQMNLYLTSAEKSRPDARRSEGNYLGVPYVHVTTPDREIHVFSAYVGEDLHVRSNSLPALQRVLAAMQGRDAQNHPVATLADTTEFAYIRTLMPRGAAQEDGFVYLSDPFIRKLVGPQLRLTEQHRMYCYNHLRMLGHASLMYRTETGRAPESVEQLVTARCLPVGFGLQDVVCPDGGKYSLSSDGVTGTCSHHGHAGALTPCLEIPLESVPEDEAEQYQRFLEEYNQYWRTFFDPIAIRIQVTPERYRLETIVLPLIDNSIYTGMANFLGGKPEPLDALPVPQRNIFSLAIKLDKRALLTSMGLADVLEAPAEDIGEVAQAQLATLEHVQALQQIGLAMHNYHDTFRNLPPRCNFARDGKPLLSWRVHLLPFLEEQALYAQFRLDEPWDSEHNKKLAAKMPKIYRPKNPQLVAANKTRFVVPVGDSTVFPKADRKTRLADVLDGTSNTAMVGIANDDQAVVWTKPDDWEVDLAKPFDKLAAFPGNDAMFLLCDGSVHLVRRNVDVKEVARLLSRADGEVLQLEMRPVQGQPVARDFLGLDAAAVNELELGKVLLKGIGNQVGFHVYDSPQAFSLSLPSMWGMLMGVSSARGQMNQEALAFGVVATSFNSPVYVAIPVADRQIVDQFLERLDTQIALQVQRHRGGGRMVFIRVTPDSYRTQLPDGTVARAFGVELGPIKWRFFWARIGDGLYVASKPEILQDLAAIQRGSEKVAARLPLEPAHALVRLRPQNWREVLPSYQLGWEENHRQACLNNLIPLGHVNRALGDEAGKPATPARAAAVENLAGRIHGVRCFCPDGGHYLTEADGGVSCSLHGSLLAGRQTLAPAPQSRQGRAPLDLRDVQVSLKFLEDGLHAIVTVDRGSK